MAKWTIEARKASLQKPMPKYLAAYLQELETGFAPEIATIEGKGTPDSFRLTEVKTGLAYLNADQTDTVIVMGLPLLGSHLMRITMDIVMVKILTSTPELNCQDALAMIQC